MYVIDPPFGSNGKIGLNAEYAVQKRYKYGTSLVSAQLKRHQK